MFMKRVTAMLCSIAIFRVASGAMVTSPTSLAVAGGGSGSSCGGGGGKYSNEGEHGSG
jgi:hypothetical protein